MFDNINLDNYIHLDNYLLEFELQKAYFLRDFLYEEISYELKEENIIIYKKLDNGISEEITLDELIFYIHTEVIYEIIQPNLFYNHRHINKFRKSFMSAFKNIDDIKKTVENMKIILKYDKDSESDEGNSSMNEEKIMIAKSRNINETPKDNSSLYF